MRTNRERYFRRKNAEISELCFFFFMRLYRVSVMDLFIYFWTCSGNTFPVNCFCGPKLCGILLLSVVSIIFL